MRMIRYVATTLAICLSSIAGGASAALSPATQPSITSEQAITLATNRITVQDASVKVESRSHSAIFTSAGLDFQPRRGPHWSWALSYIGAIDGALNSNPITSVEPVRSHPNIVAFERDGVTERYVIKRGTIEQQFVIANPLSLSGKDLLVSGQIKTLGKLETDDTTGWLWRDAQGVVSLGQVKVFDATGQNLPAKMEVAQNSTRIVVNGKALANAVYPVTIDPEVGTNDFRISEVGGVSGSTDARGLDPAVAYNSTENEYLVVWWGDPGAPFGMAGNEFEIFGQCIDADSGAVAKNDFQISTMGGVNGDGNFDARFPAVAYNSIDNEYLVVWIGEDNTGALVNEEFEVFGQLLDGECNKITGDNDIRISNIGTDGDASTGVRTTEESAPAVAHNTADNQYLVAWSGDDDNLVANNEFEIFGQLLDTDGSEIGSDFQISEMGPDNSTSFAAVSPAVAYNSADNEYLVVWWGDDDTNNDFEVFGQRVAGAGSLQGAELQISNAGSVEGNQFVARFPDVAYNPQEGEYLVVWEGDTDTVGALVDDEFEILGQLLNGDGTEKGTDFRISNMGPDGITAFGVLHDVTTPIEDSGPALAYNAINKEYLVVWEADSDTDSADGAFDIYAQRIAAATGAEIGTDERISDMGNSDTDTDFTASAAAVAFDSNSDGYLIVWHGDDDAVLSDDEIEIFGQLYAASATLRLTDSNSTVNEDVGNVSVTVERIGDLSAQVTATFAITGADVSDYTDLSTVVTFAAGSGGTQTVDVLTVSDDSVDESDETLTIALNAPTGAELAASNTSVEVTVTDNDDATSTPTPVPTPQPEPEPKQTSSGGGGGGCTLSTTSGIDPVLPMLMLLAGVYFLRRKSELH